MTAQTDFYSAYRAKSSEGTRTILSALVRCQKRVANLTQTDVVDVSVYCGGTPLARVCSLAAEATERKILLLPNTLNPDQLKAVQQYADAGPF
jgi:glycine dehydrogenase subunit 1